MKVTLQALGDGEIGDGVDNVNMTLRPRTEIKSKIRGLMKEKLFYWLFLASLKELSADQIGQGR